MSKNQRQTQRKPATKFAHLQKKIRKQKVQVKKPIGKKKGCNIRDGYWSSWG